MSERGAEHVNVALHPVCVVHVMRHTWDVAHTFVKRDTHG